MARASVHQRPAGGGFELMAWYFMRVSGLVLIFMALGHVVIMHLINSVETINYAFVASRWALPGWRVYDWVLLALAVLHGANGIRTLIDDYVHRRGWRVVWTSALYVLVFGLLVTGTEVILTFNPVS
ncbi:succinate dehydrogenase [Limnochorda pilosa]|uniref:Succinate dehydrogenase n=1 Tax=Limnochorda pilosa TaxID=1555112 RepID=A0A0K2SIV0_LIMPI|nr:succinate dehydrogenase [Limnochorda pilosa]BAS27015.1 succinate dehydrogenase [Limnochorda pilosa]